MMDQTGDIHIYLGDLAPGMTVHLHAGREDSGPAGPTDPVGLVTEREPEGLADERKMLERFKVKGHAPTLQAIYDGLVGLGYVPRVPEIRSGRNWPEPYLRWIDPARDGQAVMYFKARVFYFVKTEDLELLRNLPNGATTVGGRQHNVKFTVSAETKDEILEGARRVKR